MEKIIRTQNESSRKSARPTKTSASLYGTKKIYSMGQKMKIEAIMEQYKDEWLAIKVSKLSENHIPEEGELIAHSENREELWNQVPRNSKDTIYITYSGDLIEEGYATAY
ncbi:MAG: hypothetical protein JSV09_11620 [Thermoplasmata archaeon]|nr:MAG: hypothetical protein JSV09_11620 [Thermoplasmata archaeon]